MLTIACRDVGQPCDCVLSGETEEDLLKKEAEPNLINQSAYGVVLFISFFIGTVPALTKKSGILNPSIIIFATYTEPLASPSYG
jgi:hypothetical protein